MADLPTAVNGAFAFAHQPADLATVLGPPSESFRIPATRDVLDYAEKVETQEELNEVLRRVAPTVGVPDPYRAAIMALLCGTLIEWGADPADLAPLLFARLPAFLAMAESIPDGAETAKAEELFAANPDGVRAWHSLSLMLLPTMAVLTRGMQFRQMARENPELLTRIEALRERNREAEFVAQALSFVDGIELVVLHPAEGKGFRVELEAVHTNAHLFTLLHGSLINGGHLPGLVIEEQLLGVATGEVPHDKLLTDHARWQFYTWRGLYPDGSYAGADMSTWLFVEDPPSVIPEFEGERVLILGPPVLGLRGWDSNFFANIHDALRSAARVVGELTPEEVASLVRAHPKGAEVTATPPNPNGISPAQFASRWLLGPLFIAAGVMHFVMTDFYLKMMPAYLPWHRELVFLSGVCEIVGGVALLIPRLRRAAAWGLIALLVAVFPANVYMAFNPELFPSIPVVALWTRLPLQLALIAWAHWFTKPVSPQGAS